MEKNNIKKFVTLFREMPNVGLKKDVGMIPYIMNKKGFYNTELVTFSLKDEEYYSIINDMSDFNIKFLGEKGKNSFIKRTLVYLIKYAKEINILNLYHLRLSNGIFILLYKLLNKNGKVYLKLDIDYRFFEKNRFFLKRILYSDILRGATLCSAESTKICREVQKYSGVNCVYIPNGYYQFENQGSKIQLDDQNIKYDWNLILDNERQYIQSEKKIPLGKLLETVKEEERVNALLDYLKEGDRRIIVTVGRIGAYQKNHEMLLAAGNESMEQQEFAMVFVGPIEESFSDFFSDVAMNNPKILERVFFLGNIVDKKNLNKVYEKADIFILTSRWEGFPLVIPEALFHGCYCILTDSIYPSSDIIVNERIGEIIKSEDVKALSKSMIKWYKNIDIIRQYSADIKDYCKENFMWDGICEKIYELLNDT